MNESLAPLAVRLRRFLTRPAKEKLESLTLRLRALFPKASTTIRLPFGAKWLLEGSALDAQLRCGTFERAETRFVGSCLRPGMTVLDIGAHHGYYTLLASTLVGSKGRVFAFEPSPRERMRLERHLRMNRCTNVTIEQSALGPDAGEADLFLVEGTDDFCNSLRPPAVNAQTRKVRVSVETLDIFLTRNPIPDIDFVKLDVEGAELGVLRGASTLLSRPRRPVFMVEVYDIRTRPWGYSAREIVQFLTQRGYTWFLPAEKGKPVPIDASKSALDANLVAVPVEQMQSFRDSASLCEAGRR